MVTPAQLIKVQEIANLTVSAVADGAEISKAYISEFRNGQRLLTHNTEKKLYDYLVGVCEQIGEPFPEELTDNVSAETIASLGDALKKLNRPALLIIWA